jgi:hypothetical protein
MTNIEYTYVKFLKEKEKLKNLWIFFILLTNS